MDIDKQCAQEKYMHSFCDKLSEHGSIYQIKGNYIQKALITIRNNHFREKNFALVLSELEKVSNIFHIPLFLEV